MIISRTPLRIVFFGGGSDLPSWSRRHGGTVLGATIDKFCYLSCRRMPPLFPHRLRVVWSRTENCQHASEVRHPAVREALVHLGIERGVAVHHDGDLPARSGMGASSAFTVGLLHALYALRGYIPSKRQLAAEARDIEQARLNEFVGAADHALVAHGGLAQVTCERDGDVRVKPLTVPLTRLRELNAHLLLFFVGPRRLTTDVFQMWAEAAEHRAAEMTALAAMVEEGVNILNGGDDLERFGRLLDENWRVKRGLPGVSTPEVDTAYERALALGGLGGTLLGPGGGGFLLLFVPPAYHTRVKTMLRPLTHVPFEFERAGTEIIFADPEIEPEAEDLTSDYADHLAGRRLPEGF